MLTLVILLVTSPLQNGKILMIVNNHKCTINTFHQNLFSFSKIRYGCLSPISSSLPPVDEKLDGWVNLFSPLNRVFRDTLWIGLMLEDILKNTKFFSQSYAIQRDNYWFVKETIIEVVLDFDLKTQETNLKIHICV